jgi:type I restriction enzyme S subunit
MNTSIARLHLNSDINDPSAVPTGYKHTEVGIIPLDWDPVRVGDIAKVKGGKRLPSGFVLVDTPTPHPYLRVIDMHSGGVNQADIKYVPEQAFPAIQNYRIYSEDIFISVAGSLGIVGVVPPELSGANLTENANYITDLQCDRDYLKYWLMSHPIQKTIKLIQTTGAQPKLALGRIAKFVIAIPQDIEEQRAIAEVLSDVDGLINALDALIAKKRAIKQATMQQLLTGKTRLPGFSGAWETKRLGELGPFVKGRGIKRDDVTDEGVPCLRYGELYTQYQDYILKVASRIPPNVAATALPIKTGDLLFAGSGETAEEIGRCAAYLGEEQAYAGGDVIVLTPSGQNSIYLGHLMNSSTVSTQKARMGQGDAVVHIYINNLAQVQIELPPIIEQNAIADVLSDMDAEISALEQRRDKTIAIKQGMMQQLLTGRVRLVKPVASTSGAEGL